VPGLQSRVVDKARDAPNLASTLNIAGFNLGNALGAFLGGMVIDFGLGLTRVPFAGVLLAVLGLVCAVVGARGDRT
jgi:DHA1 family inner membrane transport protein